MRKTTLLIAALIISFAIRAQQTIDVEDAGKHVGDSVKICTKIYGGIFLERSQGTPTFLNAGAAYPNSKLTIVIWADTRKQFKEAPEVFYKDKEVCVTGKIILYKDKPEIVIYDEKQLAVKE